MSNSKRFNQLTSRIDFIETTLLPAVNILGSYSKKDSDLIRSYVLLVHAEIESYFEDVAEIKANKALNHWKLNRTKSNCLLSIMIFCGCDIKWEIPEKDPNKTNNDKQKLEYRVVRTVSHYINILKSNHGVKAKNILNMLLPLGVELDSLDQTWLSIMDSFGAKRGLIAHSTISTQSQIDLVTERNNINNFIMPGIGAIDLIIKKIG